VVVRECYEIRAGDLPCITRPAYCWYIPVRSWDLYYRRMRGTWPFVGRSDQVELLRKELARAAAPGAIVVAGPAGVGKSRLIVEVLAGFDARRVAVLLATATAATRSLPYGAFAHLLAARPGSTSEEPTGPRAIAAELLSHATGRRVVLAVDDAHLLDGHSASLVHHLVRDKAAAALVTLRSGEPPPPAAVVALWTEALADRIELGPLNSQEVRAVLEAVLGGPVDPATCQRLFLLSEGNALLLRELVLAADDNGALTSTNGVWSVCGPLPVSVRLTELIDVRLGLLSPGELDVLELVAFSEPIGVDLVCALTGDELVEAVEAKHLIRVETDVRRLQLRLAHPLYGEVIRARCPALRKRRQLRRLAEALEATGARRRDDILRVATWRLDSGTKAHPALLTTAAQFAWAGSHDIELAARLGRAAIQAGAGVEATVALAKAMIYADRPMDGERALAAVAERATTDQERVALATTRATNLWFGFGRLSEACQILDNVTLANRDVDQRAQLHATRAFLCFYAADFDTALEHAERVLSTTATTTGPGAEAAAVKAMILAYHGRARESLDLAQSTLAVSHQWRPDSAIAEKRLHHARGIAHLFSGNLTDGLRIVEQLHTELIDSSWQMGLGMVEAYTGFMLLLQGQIEQATLWSARAAERCPAGQTAFGTSISGVYAQCAAVHGDLDTATRVLDGAQRHRNDAARLWEFFVDLARPLVAASQGRRAEAIDLALHTADQARQATVFGFELLALHQLASLGAAAQACDRLHQLATAMEGELAPAYAAHAKAAASADAAGLEAASAILAELGLLLDAAEAAAQASTVYQTTGRADRARATSARAWALAQDCPGARTPTLLALASPGLTAREREIAALAIAGLTSREIAQRIIISVRTVDNHLRSIYTKLGISSRIELPASLAAPSRDVSKHRLNRD
jgi:DNA-binding CsgD family transcriptional regulator